MIKYIIGSLAVLGTVTFANNHFDSMSKEQQAEYEILVVHKPTGKVMGKFTRATHKVVKLGTGITVQDLADEHQAGFEHGKQSEIQSTTYSVIGSVGPGRSGLRINKSGSTVSVREEDAVVGQVQFCATESRIGACLGAATNNFFSVGFKYDWK